MPRKTVADLSIEVAAIAESVNALAALIEGGNAKPKARKPKAAPAFPAVGSTFTYVAKSGNSVEHTIEAIRGRGKRRRAFTDNGNKFPVALLSNEKLLGTVVIPA